VQGLLEQRLWLGAMLCAQGFTAFAALLDQRGFVDWRGFGDVGDDRSRRIVIQGVTSRFRALVGTMALLWRLSIVAGLRGMLMVARVAVVLLVIIAARVGTLVRVLVGVVVVARSLVVPRRRRSRSASAVNGVVTGWGRSRSNCLVLDNLAFGCRTVAHVESLGAVRCRLLEDQAGAEAGKRRRRIEQAGTEEQSRVGRRIHAKSATPSPRRRRSVLR